GFQKCVNCSSTSTTSASPAAPNDSPNRAASSRPPAPPPTMTILCRFDASSSSVERNGERSSLAAPAVAPASLRRPSVGMLWPSASHFGGREPGQYAVRAAQSPTASGRPHPGGTTLAKRKAAATGESLSPRCERAPNDCESTRSSPPRR